MRLFRACCSSSISSYSLTFFLSSSTCSFFCSLLFLPASFMSSTSFWCCTIFSFFRSWSLCTSKSSSLVALSTSLWSSASFLCFSSARNSLLLARCSSHSRFTCNALVFASSLWVVSCCFQRCISASWCISSCWSSATTRCLRSFFSSICSSKSRRICCCCVRVSSRCCSFSRSSTSLACLATSDQRLICLAIWDSGTDANAFDGWLSPFWPPGARACNSASTSAWWRRIGCRADREPSRQDELQENSETDLTSSPRALSAPSAVLWKTRRSRRPRFVALTRPLSRKRSTSFCTSVALLPPRASMSRSSAERSSSRCSVWRRPWPCAASHVDPSAPETATAMAVPPRTQ
mmetsp:Transcript_34122/g.79292  ORF Transcript_34122/g.79292 Transcript_34122/m.79292 type:complete len:349 (+) Transcript_34122:98-1144(+)